MNEHVFGPIITGCVTVLFGWLIVSGFRSGAMEWPYFGITIMGRRRDQPVRFWAVAIALGLIASIAALVTVAQIAWARGL